MSSRGKKTHPKVDCFVTLRYRDTIFPVSLARHGIFSIASQMGHRQLIFTHLQPMSREGSLPTILFTDCYRMLILASIVLGLRFGCKLRTFFTPYYAGWSPLPGVIKLLSISLRHNLGYRKNLSQTPSPGAGSLQ